VEEVIKMTWSYIRSFIYLILSALFLYSINSTGFSNAQDEWLDPDRDLYISFAKDESILGETGHIVYRVSRSIFNQDAHGYRRILEIFGDGTMLYCERHIYINLDDMSMMDKSSFEAYTLNDYEYVKEIFKNIADTELFDEEIKDKYKGFNVYKRYTYMASYISNYRKRIARRQETEGDEDKFPIVSMLIEGVINHIISEGELSSPEEILEIKEIYDENYNQDEFASTGFIKMWIERESIAKS
jgi:hypothetical protein